MHVYAGIRQGLTPEIIGLRWRNVNLEKGEFSVVEQIPYRLPVGTTSVTEMAPVKSSERVLPITRCTQRFFEAQKDRQERQRELLMGAGEVYHDNDLVIAKPNGAPERRDRPSVNFSQMLRHNGLRHIRFHDLRHTAATNMYELTGDFYTVGQILGHSLKGVGIQLGISNNLDAVTAQYVDVRLERKLQVLEVYHKVLLSPKVSGDTE